MPLATSPYQQNDYTSLSSRTPYRLNIQAVAQTAMALDQFWKRGAERVKSAYDSALNLDLTSDENKEVKKKFLEDAQTQLTKLASQDLSDPSVQRQGIGIFTPIFQDQAIMQDDHLTKLKQSIFAEAEQYKRDPKTKGAGFHIDNLTVALEGFQGFNNKTARNQIGNIFENAKDSQYIPFYDDSKEMMDILKNCKSSKLSNDTPTASGFVNTYSVNTLSDAKLYGCLEAGLSGMSRQQTRISGMARYGHDYQAVRNDYINSANGKKDYYKTTMLAMKAKRDGLATNVENKDQVAELDAQIAQLDTEVGKLDKQLATVNTWDDKFIQDHYGDLAGDAFFHRSKGAFATAFANTDIQSALKRDPMSIAVFTQNEMNKRQAAAAQDALDLEDRKFQHKLLSGTDSEGKPTGDMIQRVKACAADPNCKQKIGQFITQAYKEPATTSNKIKAQITDLSGQKLSLVQDLKNDPFVQEKIGDIDPGGVLNFNEENYNKMWGILNEYIKTADDSDPNKQRLIEATNKLLELDNRKTALQGILDDAEGQVGAKNPQLKIDFDKKSSALLSSTAPAKMFDGQVIEAGRVANIIQGIDPDLHVDPYVSQQYGPGSTPSTTLYPVRTKDGKQVGWLDRKNVDIAEGYKSLNNSLHNSYLSELDKYLGENTAVQKMGLSTGDLFTKGSIGETYLKTVFGSNLGIIGEAATGQGVVFNSVGGLNPTTGKVVIQATNKDGQLSFKAMRDAMAKSGVAQNLYGTEVPNNPNAMEITIPDAVGLIQQPLYEDILRFQLNYLEQRAPTLPNTGIQMHVGKDRTGTSYGIKVKKKLGSNGADYSIIISNKGITKEYPAKNTNQIDPKENTLSQLDRLLEGKLTEVQLNQ